MINFLKDLLIVVKIFWNKRLLDNKYGWFGNYSNWDEAVMDSEGYNSDEIIKKTKKAALMVAQGEYPYERDSKCFDKIQYSWGALSSLLHAYIINDSFLNVIDFGGGLGTSYFQNLKFTKSLNISGWNIIDQKEYYQFGKRNISNGKLKFFRDYKDSLEKDKPNTLLLSGVLQYLKYPYKVLEEMLASKDIVQVIIDRTPFTESSIDRITVQKVNPKLYNASYPCWHFSELLF